MGHIMASAHMIISTPASQRFRALRVADIRAVYVCAALGKSALGILIIVLRYARGVRVQSFREIRGLKISSREVLFSSGVQLVRFGRVSGARVRACSVCACVGAAAVVAGCAVVVEVLEMCCVFVLCAPVQISP